MFAHADNEVGNDPHRDFDLYVHWKDSGEVGTVIARYGNAGEEYASGLGMLFCLPLAEAARRVLDKYARGNGLSCNIEAYTATVQPGVVYEIMADWFRNTYKDCRSYDTSIENYIIIIERGGLSREEIDKREFLVALRRERDELIKKYNDRVIELKKYGFQYYALPNKLLVVLDKTETMGIH